MFLFLNSYISIPFTSFRSNEVNDCYHLQKCFEERMKIGALGEVCLKLKC